MNSISFDKSRRVLNYRFYLLNANGMIDTAQVHRLADDAAALSYARDLGHSNPVEVWQQERRIGMIPPQLRR